MKHHYIQWDTNLATALNGEYHALIVFFSYAVAVLAGFCAFQIINFIQLNKSKRIPLLILGGLVLGIGIWSMHFTGMLAFKLPITVLYNPEITLVSVLPAIAVSIIFLNNLSRDDFSVQRALVTGIVLAGGIASMHFIGMFAMSMPATMVHDPIMTLFAILASWGLAVLTIFIQKKNIKFGDVNDNIHMLISALAFGFSVASVHYLAMSSTYFFADNTTVISGFSDNILANGLIVFAVLLMAFLMLILFYHNKISYLMRVASSSHQRIIETIDNMQDGFILSDEHGKILLINKKIQQTFASHTSNKLFDDDDINSFYTKLIDDHFYFSNSDGAKQLLDIVTSRSSLLGSFKVKDQDNKWWLLRQNRTSADTIIQTWTDISEQIAQEDELLETKKMASLGGLVSGVAHELNTPLGVGITSSSSIRELIEILQGQITAGTIKKSTLEDSLSTISQLEALTAKNLSRMAKLIQQFKYISIDQEPEESAVFLFSDIRDNIVKIWGQQLAERQLTLVIHAEQDGQLIGYENTLVQVISSLISNSVDHAFKENEAGNIEITATFNDDRLQLVYRDNGCGIDQEVVSRIFEPFVTTKRHEGGVGLGLHITYNLVCQKLKGKIKLVESPSCTSFLIDIPNQ